MAIRKALFALTAATVALSAPAPIQASCAAATTLSGKWKGDDGGTYRIRAAGNEIFWIGTSPDGGKSWTNVMRGLRNPETKSISGRWADIAQPGGVGALVIAIKSNNLLVRTSSTGSPFGGTKWTRVVTCDDVGMNPV